MKRSHPPIKDIMRLTGLSRATVDRALNGRSGVQTKTQECVKLAMQQLLAKPKVLRQRTADVRKVVCIVQAGDAFAQSIVDQCAALAIEIPLQHGIALSTCSCVSSSNEQVAETILGQSDADGLIIIAKNAPPITNAVMTLRSRGVAIVAAQSDLDYAARHAYVGIDNRVAGQSAGFLMGRCMPHEAEVKVAFMVDTVYYRCHEEREMGFRTAIRQRFPWLSVIDVVMDGDNDRAAYKAMTSMLDEHPHIAGIYNTAGGNGGVARALRERDRVGKTVFIAHERNFTTEMQTRLGAIDFLLSQDLESVLSWSIDCVERVLNHSLETQQITIPLEIFCSYSLPPQEANLQQRHALPRSASRDPRFSA